MAVSLISGLAASAEKHALLNALPVHSFVHYDFNGSIYHIKVKVKYTWYSASSYSESPPQKRSCTTRVLKGFQFYLHTHTFIRNRNEPYACGWNAGCTDETVLSFNNACYILSALGTLRTEALYKWTTFTFIFIVTLQNQCQTSSSTSSSVTARPAIGLWTDLV